MNDRIRNSVNRELYELNEDALTRIETVTLYYFGHTDSMKEDRLTKEIHGANVEGPVREVPGGHTSTKYRIYK